MSDTRVKQSPGYLLSELAWAREKLIEAERDFNAAEQAVLPLLRKHSTIWHNSNAYSISGDGERVLIVPMPAAYELSEGEGNNE